MLYTISGIIIGTLSTFVIAKVCDVDFSHSQYFPSNGSLMVMMGGIIGGAIGFGIGITKISNGTYPF